MEIDGKCCQLLKDYRYNLKMSKKFEKVIDSYALGTLNDYKTSTMGQLNRIQELCSIQKKYISKVMIVKATMNLLPEIERMCLTHFYVNGHGTNHVFEIFKFSERTFYRHKKIAVEHFNELCPQMQAKFGE